MTTEKHTPGPWHIAKAKGKSGRTIMSADGFAVAKATPCRDLMGQHHAKANARLIAAAPDLLAALKALRDANGSNNFSGWHENFHDAIKMALAAIDKAEGGAA